jgi:hypothetical protein
MPDSKKSKKSGSGKADKQASSGPVISTPKSNFLSLISPGL